MRVVETSDMIREEVRIYRNNKRGRYCQEQGQCRSRQWAWLVTKRQDRPARANSNLVYFFGVIGHSGHVLARDSACLTLTPMTCYSAEHPARNLLLTLAI